jgi:hypothetical protein
MFGMSDDDDAENEEREAGDQEMERNVVASTLSEARGDGAFAGAALSFDSEPLGLSGLETLEQEPSRPQRSPLMTSSPLIAQLNPFGTPPWAEPQSPHGIPEFELPVAAFAALSASGEIDPLGKNADQHLASAAYEVGNPELPSVVRDDSQAGPVDLLLVEMGDLVCRLQRKRELAIAAHEVTADELLARLAHFQEIADRIELTCAG